MDKQIIVDGVDVNALYPDQIACMNRYEVANLFIKTVERLVTKEQECERLKIYIESNEQQVKEVETLVMDNDRLINELDQLKEELAISIQENEEGREINAELKAKNEQLKKEIRLYDCIDKWGTEQCHCACRCLGNEFCDDADKKINKLKQALTEIKEIAYIINDRTMVADYICDHLDKILQKCEVLDEHN